MENGIKVLIATDFSQNAENAFKYGVNFVSKFKCELFLLNVYEAFQITTEAPVSYNIEKETKKIVENSLNQLNSHCQYVNKNFPDIVCKPLTIEDFPERGIVRMAKEHDIDLIILGVKKRNAVERLIMGNTTTKVFGNVKCPVLVVPMDNLFKDIQSIVYAGNLSNAEVQKINQAAAVAKAFGANLTVVNVSEEKKPEREFKLEKYKNDIKEFLSIQPTEWLSVQGENKVKAIQKVVTDKHADLLVVSGHSPLYLESFYRDSITEEVLTHLTLPLLVFHLDIEDE